MAVERRPPRPAAGEDAHCRGRRPLAAPRSPRLGGALLVGAAALAALVAPSSPAAALALAAGAVLLVVVGKEAAIPAALLLGAGPLALAACLTLVEVGLLLVWAPRIAGHRPPRLVAAAARRRIGAGRPRSALRLYASTLVPFAFLGSATAVLVGGSAGLPPRRVLAAVAAAGATSVAAWTAFYALGALGLGPLALWAALAVAAPLDLLGAARALAGGRVGGRAGGRTRRAAPSARVRS